MEVASGLAGIGALVTGLGAYLSPYLPAILAILLDAKVCMSS